MAQDSQAQSVADRVYQDLWRRILAFELRPGQRLVEDELARQYGLSRTPVREALKRLEQAGLVRSAPRRGCHVREVNLGELEELYEVRLALESYAVAVAAERMPDAELQRLRAIWSPTPSAPPDVQRLLTLDEAFHLDIARATANTTLVDYLRSINDRIRVIRVRDHMSPERALVTYRQHQAILELLSRRDAAAATEAMKEHIRESQRNVVNVVKELLFQLYLRGDDKPGLASGA